MARYWRAIELFSPQALPRVDARSHVEDVNPGEPMPWEAGSQLSRVPLAEGKTWRHEVFGWLAGFDQDVLHFSGELAKLTGKDFGSGVHLLAASMREAVPVAVQEGVKAAVTGVLLPAGPLAAAGSAPQPPTRLETHPLTGADVQRFAEQLAERLGVSQALEPRNVRVWSYQLSAARAG